MIEEKANFMLAIAGLVDEVLDGSYCWESIHVI